MQHTLFDQDEPSTPQTLSDRQIVEARQRHPGMILLFRSGDRYLVFSDDAISLAEVLGLELTGPTSRRVAGFPYHSLETHLRKLLSLGHRVAICDSEENNA